jgi:hypothetical protein
MDLRARREPRFASPPRCADAERFAASPLRRRATRHRIPGRPRN